jgi:hypothetical protein
MPRLASRRRARYPQLPRPIVTLNPGGTVARIDTQGTTREERTEDGLPLAPGWVDAAGSGAWGAWGA